jgi:hypothetical protein
MAALVYDGRLIMSPRISFFFAASVIIGIACIVTASTETFASPAGLTRLDHSRHYHHRYTVHHSGQVRH